MIGILDWCQSCSLRVYLWAYSVHIHLLCLCLWYCHCHCFVVSCVFAMGWAGVMCSLCVWVFLWTPHAYVTLQACSHACQRHVQLWTVLSSVSIPERSGYKQADSDAQGGALATHWELVYYMQHCTKYMQLLFESSVYIYAWWTKPTPL